ncbi:hypothetical protein H4R34_003509 [Dimargaris verticillata]|uniref:BHLH domain-containing protein n=1 Tax=Dimargaris verticillata TaxID=2761393 RepID=A0A9W8B0Q2_9FUNG|nr:hypothetical protein H4R34_003509 [Dimargaris verticillata]
MSHPAPAASETLVHMDMEPTAMNQQAFQALSSVTAPNTRCSSPVLRAEDDHMSDGGEYPANKPLFLNFTSDLAPFNSSKRQKTRKNNVYRVSGINILNRNSVDSKTAMERLQKRRENHNFVERRRRDNINQTITELAAAIPNSQRDGNKLHKGNVLRLAVEHIRDLQAENIQLRQQLGLASPHYPLSHAVGGTSTPSSSGQMSPLGGESSGMLSDATHSPSHVATTAEGANSSATAVSSTKLSPATSVTPNPSRRQSINHYHNSTPPYVGSSRPNMTLSGGPLTAPILGGSSASSTPVTPVFRPTQMDTLPHLNRYYAPPPSHGLPHITMPLPMPENLEHRLRENPNVVSTPLPSISNTPIPSVPNSPGISPNRPIEELVPLPQL